MLYVGRHDCETVVIVDMAEIVRWWLSTELALDERLQQEKASCIIYSMSGKVTDCK